MKSEDGTAAPSEKAVLRQRKKDAAAAKKAARDAKKAEKEKRGSILQFGALGWPPDVPRTPKHERKKGAFRIKSVDDVILQIRRTAIKMEGLQYLSVGWAVSKYALDQAFSAEHEEPGIAMYYGGVSEDGAEWNRRIVMDKFNTAAGNLRAVSNGFRAMCALMQCEMMEWVDALDGAMLLALPLKDKAGMPLRNANDALKVLELDNMEGLTLEGLKLQRLSLQQKYHGDHNEQNAASFQAINAAAQMLESALKSKANEAMLDSFADNDTEAFMRQRAEDVEARARQRVKAQAASEHSEVKVARKPPAPNAPKSKATQPRIVKKSKTSDTPAPDERDEVDRHLDQTIWC